ncbi:MAG: class I SAM-dependent methyltransferase [Deltaproteobacteria bacterium]|nr:MAG: class I SAM-dependent methyltransferase [Deltaproteobacteria bacterium]
MHHQKLFNDKADLYKSARPTYPHALYPYLAGLCSATNCVWDCACGNGQAAVELAEQFDMVFATDISEKQISNAKKHPGIHYSVSPAESTCFLENSLDLVCVAQALHWFDLKFFWPEVARVLKPNGIFSAWGYTWPQINRQLDDAFKQLVLDVIEPYWASRNKLLWEHYKDIHFPFKEKNAPEFEMSIKWDLDGFFNFVHTFSATRQCMGAIGNHFFAYAYSEMNKLWGNSKEKKWVSLDFVFYAGAF